jgi:serralysin
MTMTSQASFSGNAEIDGVFSGTKWSSLSLTFSFAAPQGVNATYFNSTQIGAVRQILSSIAALTDLSFTEVAEPQTTGTLRFGESASKTTASAYLPSEHELGGDCWFNPYDYNSPKKGTYAYATFMHETGHSLGLDHGQDGAYALPAERDSLEYSVMSYRSYVDAPLTGYTVRDGSYPRSFMLSDIAALQYLYGADYGANAGATTYKWSPSTGELFINGISAARSTTNTILETIWDGGGVDTYDFSSHTSGVKVDINPGAWSTTNTSQLAQLGYGHVARGNIANAYLYDGNKASLIENVKGGAGSDRLVGNAAANLLEGNAGNDTIYGGAGKDVLTGGAGYDRFVFNKKPGSTNVDQITDFRHDTDMILLNDTTFTGVGTRLDPGEFYARSGAVSAHDSSDRIVYDTGSGRLYYDADGNKVGGAAAVLFCTVTNKPFLDYGDFAIV